MRLLILTLLLLGSTGCSSLSNGFGKVVNGITSVFSGDSNSDESEKSNKKKIEDNTGNLISYLSYIFAIFGIISIIAGFKFPMAWELSPLFGAGWATCYVLALLLEYLLFVIAGLIGYAAFRIWQLRKKHDKNDQEKESLLHELANYFDDQEGVDKLSEDAKNIYIKHRPIQPDSHKTKKRIPCLNSSNKQT